MCEGCKPPEAVTEFVYHADLVITNDWGGVALEHVNSSGLVVGDWCQRDLELAALDWAAEHLGADRTNTDLVTFSYTTLTKATNAPPAA